MSEFTEEELKCLWWALYHYAEDWQESALLKEKVREDMLRVLRSTEEKVYTLIKKSQSAEAQP